MVALRSSNIVFIARSVVIPTAYAAGGVFGHIHADCRLPAGSKNTAFYELLVLSNVQHYFSARVCTDDRLPAFLLTCFLRGCCFERGGSGIDSAAVFGDRVCKLRICNSFADYEILCSRPSLLCNRISRLTT